MLKKYPLPNYETLGNFAHKVLADDAFVDPKAHEHMARQFVEYTVQYVDSDLDDDVEYGGKYVGALQYDYHKYGGYLEGDFRNNCVCSECLLKLTPEPENHGLTHRYNGCFGEWDGVPVAIDIRGFDEETGEVCWHRMGYVDSYHVIQHPIEQEMIVRGELLDYEQLGFSFDNETGAYDVATSFELLSDKLYGNAHDTEQRPDLTLSEADLIGLSSDETLQV